MRDGIPTYGGIRASGIIRETRARARAPPPKEKRSRAEKPTRKAAEVVHKGRRAVPSVYRRCAHISPAAYYYNRYNYNSRLRSCDARETLYRACTGRPAYTGRAAENRLFSTPNGSIEPPPDILPVGKDQRAPESSVRKYRDRAIDKSNMDSRQTGSAVENEARRTTKTVTVHPIRA